MISLLQPATAFATHRHVDVSLDNGAQFGGQMALSEVGVYGLTPNG